MYAWQVLLSAESFGDLISRYKYLYLTSRHDRALLTEVEDLRDRVATRRNELLGLRTTLDRSRAERDAELNRYTNLANTSERRLRQLQRTGQETERQLTQLERDEESLNRQITSLIAAARRAGPARPGTITTADIGQLDWPVQGRIVFNFGRDRQPDGVVLRHNGIGIGAAEGTPVRVISGGTVVRIQRWSTYGLLVLVDHGAEHYSLYAQLGQALVAVGATVTKGQTIGTIGSANSEYGSHLHFEIRGAQGIALDPTAWLRSQSN
jgi:septal ring factor EnvC (AmiA/AmiB activator)